MYYMISGKSVQRRRGKRQEDEIQHILHIQKDYINMKLKWL